MSDDETTRDRETEASPGDNEDRKSTSPEMLPKKDIYSRFVSSFENALTSLTSTVSTAVGSEGTRLFSRYIHLYVCYSEGRCLKKYKLRSFSLEGIAEYIKTDRPCNVIVMSGAGISTSAGVPDFRSPGMFFAFVFIFKPTLCHYFVRLLDKKGILRRWFTQNIDSLEFLTGISEDKVVTAHGSCRTSTCITCGKKFDLQWLTNHLKNKGGLVPRCDKCEGVVKPDITFFGENLPKRFFQCVLSDFPKCDLLLIMGTSLVVQPFASLVNEVGLILEDLACAGEHFAENRNMRTPFDHNDAVAEDIPRLLINKEEVGRTSEFERALGFPGLCYGLKDNKRDVFWGGSCDDGCKRLAELLDWEHELDHLIQEGELRYNSQ
uniref:Deacetylase sirtuin-type domain-containing protein n=1 Tax=Angiostrongylus cantonensis TaxID=6313 RepID=A0A0K0CWV5_ANGCA